jgi:hypothetical protein
MMEDGLPSRSGVHRSRALSRLGSKIDLDFAICIGNQPEIIKLVYMYSVTDCDDVAKLTADFM